MPKLKNLAVILLVALVLGPAARSSAEDADGSFEGRFLVGYRSVDVDGSNTKYREDLNLDDGPRLFELRFDFVAPETLRQIDRIQLDVHSFGGDPFESFRFSVEKFGRYDLEYRRTTSEYFYADVILPIELSTPALANAGDFHTFDFERVRDYASFGFRFNKRARLEVDFDRYTRRGESTTTLDIQRDEFEFDRPIDESYHDLGVALELDWDRVTLILEERIRSFDNAVEIFLPGLSLGEDPEDATILDFFFLDQPYELDSVEHTVRLNARPNDRLLIRAAASLQDLELDVTAEETSQGLDFRGNPFTTDASGGGAIDRDHELFDVDVSYMLRDNVVLVGGLRQQNLDQDGAFLFGGDPGRGAWEIDSTTVEAGVQFHASPRLTIGGGLRQETRQVDADISGGGLEAIEDEETEHTGFFANLAYRPSKAFRLDLEVEDSSYDDPFTVTSPTDRQRWRLRGRYRWDNGCYFQGTYRAFRYENDPSGWQSDRDQLEVRGGLRRKDLELALGYSLIEADRQIDQTVTTVGFGGGASFLFPILYTTEAEYIDGVLRWRPNSRWTVGGDLRWYQNEGSFAHERTDARAYVELRLEQGYLLRLGLRSVEYDEDLFDWDDHEAEITEFSVGYDW